MTNYLKQSLKTDLCLSFAQSFASNSEDNYFLFLGKVDSWNDSDTPPAVSDTLSEDLSAWRNMVALAKINQSNVIVGARRINWEYNKLFTQFDDTEDLFIEGSEKDFYCITDEYNVYKCLNNNYNSKSLFKPSSISSEEEIMEDGYIWKFLFKIREELYDFLTDDFIPIEKLETIMYEDERSLQVDVKIGSVPSSIENIVLTKYGAAYPLSVTTDPTDTDRKHRIIEIISSNEYTVTGIEDMDPTSGIYNDYYELYISEGTGSGTKSVITDYTVIDGVYTITTQNPLDVAVGSIFKIYPRIDILGDGENASCIPILNSEKIITDVLIINSGKNYRYAEVEIYRKNGNTANTPTARAILSPIQGHGFNVFRDLGADKILIYIPITSKEKNITSNVNNILLNDYRQIGIVKNVFKNDSTDLIPITTAENIQTYIDIENTNSKTKIYIESEEDLITVLSGSDLVVTQGSINNNYQARGIFQSIEEVSTDNYIITLISSNGRFLDANSSSYPLIIETSDTQISGTITGVVVTDLYDQNTFQSNDYIVGAGTASTAKITQWVCNPYGLSGRLYVNNVKGKFRSSFYSKDQDANIVLVKGERIVGYQYINEDTGEFVGVSSSTLGTVREVGSYDPIVKQFYKISTSFELTPVSGSFTSNIFAIDDLIKNNIGSTARIIQSTLNNSSSITLEVTGITGSFSVGDLIIIGEESSTATNAEINNIVQPEILPYYGDIIYIQNVLPVTSGNDSEEHIKLLVKF